MGIPVPNILFYEEKKMKSMRNNESNEYATLSNLMLS